MSVESRPRYIAVLEDDERRQVGMRQILAAHFPEYVCVFFDNAPDMLTWLADHLGETSLICLDHDLGPSRLREGERFEPASGRDVVDFLAKKQPRCPVVVHTTNYTAAPGMVFALESSGWDVDRVVPFDDLAWLEASWLPAVTAKLSSSKL